MGLLAPLAGELEHEAGATRRLLERIPEDKLDWRPHAKSMTLGQLGLHIASLPAAVSELSKADEVPAPDFDQVASPESKQQILTKHDESVPVGIERLTSITDEAANAIFRVKNGDKEVMAIPKVAMFRGIMLNHIYHHRGQLTVYLRLLDVDLPATYGASKDDKPLNG